MTNITRRILFLLLSVFAIQGISAQSSSARSQIHMLARAYGDSIVLRWAAEDYVSQRYLNRVGVNIYRYDLTDDYKCDTIVYQKKPLSLDEWRAAYPNQNDTLAYTAMSLLYGDTKMTANQTRNFPGSIGSLMEYYDDQQTHLAFAILLSEWRRDLADGLAMRALDTNVKKGHRYEYILQPAVRDTTMTIIFDAGHISGIVNEKYTPQKFDVEVGDSIVGPYTVRLWWENRKHSSYEIERREVNGKKKGEWVRVNNKPVMMMPSETYGSDQWDCSYLDIVPKVGEYEYRIFAHDAFGDLTESSPVHRVEVKDLSAVVAPDITLIEIDRQDPNDLTKKVLATIHFHKETMEDDYTGFMPMYYSERITGKQWRSLLKQPLQPTDTICTVDVTGLTTGMIVVCAYDEAGNMSYSLPRMIRIRDLKAPDAPKNFKSEIIDNDLGLVRLSWETDEDDIEYFELAYANDTTHQFMLRSQGKLMAHSFVDTLAVDVNQKYIYYKVRAIDYSTNEGDYTPVLQVLRPSILPPSQAHLDSTWVSPEAVNMRWVCANEAQMKSHRLLRRQENQQKWETVKSWTAEEVKLQNNEIMVSDAPAFDRETRYQYAIESEAVNGKTAMSLIYSVRFAGKAVFDWPIKLFGEYNKDAKETRLVWECDDNLPFKGQWYFCIWRKGARDERPKFLLSAKKEDRMFTDKLLRPGEQAEYYIFIQYRDGRKSRASNVVKVSAPVETE